MALLPEQVRRRLLQQKVYARPRRMGIGACPHPAQMRGVYGPFRVDCQAVACLSPPPGRLHIAVRPSVPARRRSSHFGVARPATVAAKLSAPGTRIASPFMQAR